MEIRTLQISDEAALARAHQRLASKPGGQNFIFNFSEDLPFSEYVQLLRDWECGKNLPEKFVSNTMFVGLIDQEIVGRISIRHHLNENLTQDGGHIGYHTVPGFEGRGYATALMRHALAFCRQLGIEQALMFCAEENLASRHIIETKFGGVLQDTRFVQDLDEILHRFWVPTKISP